MAYENGKKRAGRCGSFMTSMNNDFHGAFLAVMDMIALREWSPDLIAERTGWSGRGAGISHEL